MTEKQSKTKKVSASQNRESDKAWKAAKEAGITTAGVVRRELAKPSAPKTRIYAGDEVEVKCPDGNWRKGKVEAVQEYVGDWFEVKLTQDGSHVIESVKNVRKASAPETRIIPADDGYTVNGVYYSSKEAARKAASASAPETRKCETCGLNVYLTRWDHHKTWCNAEQERDQWKRQYEASLQVIDELQRELSNTQLALEAVSEQRDALLAACKKLIVTMNGVRRYEAIADIKDAIAKVEGQTL